MSVRCRVMNVVRANPELEVTQLRIGRIVVLEQKGKLDNKSEDEILNLLKPSVEQDALDVAELSLIQGRQKEYE